MPVVKFTVNLAADDHSNVYDAFIKDLRNRLAVGERINNIPILATDGELDFFDVVLSYTDGPSPTRTIHVRFRTDNLYLVGYREQNSTIWYELRHENSTNHLINEPGTTTQILSFGENYNDLVGTAGVELEQVPLSSNAIGAAITTLAASTTTDDGPRARAILTLIFAISEAARLEDISSLVTRSWWVGSTPGTQFANRVRSWARLSSAVQRAQNEGHWFEFDGQSTGISNLAQALAALGIMHLGHRFSASNARPERSISDMGSNTLYAQGQPLLEIFHVRINKIPGETTGRVYGNINVTDSASTTDIWTCPRDDPLHITPVDDLVLTGPTRPLYAADELYINLKLWHYNYILPDLRIAEGTIAFNPFDYYTTYDCVTDRDVEGFGSVSVSYRATRDGLYAQISVILIDGDDEDTPEVYGTLIANNGDGDSTLFCKTENERVEVKRGDPIILSRSIVTVPVYRGLWITADLWDYDSWSPNDPIAQGSAMFPPLYDRSYHEEISGKYGKIEVRVSWM